MVSRLNFESYFQSIVVQNRLIYVSLPFSRLLLVFAKSVSFFSCLNYFMVNE